MEEASKGDKTAGVQASGPLSPRGWCIWARACSSLKGEGRQHGRHPSKQYLELLEGGALARIALPALAHDRCEARRAGGGDDRPQALLHHAHCCLHNRDKSYTMKIATTHGVNSNSTLPYEGGKHGGKDCMLEGLNISNQRTHASDMAATVQPAKSMHPEPHHRAECQTMRTCSGVSSS